VLQRHSHFISIYLIATDGHLLLLRMIVLRNNYSSGFIIQEGNDMLHVKSCVGWRL